MLAVTKAGWALAWPHRWILPTSKKTMATWPLSEQMELTPPLPVLVLGKDRSGHRLQTSTVSKDLLRANTRKRAAGEPTGPVYRCNPAETRATEEGLFIHKTPLGIQLDWKDWR